MTRVLPFPAAKPAQPVTKPDQQGRFLYELYRQCRIEQGWEEFKWESLSDPQRLVWARVTERLSLLSIQGPIG